MDGAACSPDVVPNTVRNWMRRGLHTAEAEAVKGAAVHRLRHTFCSMLAAQGAPVDAIQELPGHQHITTTMKYMHLSPSNRENAIRLLDAARQEPRADGNLGDILLSNDVR